jgi:hypothetical protein
MSCEYCGGFYGRCMPKSFICKHCERISTIARDAKDQFETHKSFHRAALKANGCKPIDLKREEFDKFYLIDHIRKLEKMLGKNVKNWDEWRAEVDARMEKYKEAEAEAKRKANEA